MCVYAPRDQAPFSSALVHCTLLALDLPDGYKESLNAMHLYNIIIVYMRGVQRTVIVYPSPSVRDANQVELASEARRTKEVHLSLEVEDIA